MLADKKIWELLNDTNRKLDEEYTRLILIELFNRLKTLENENHTLKVLLFEFGVINEKVYFDALEEVDAFFREWDEERAKQVEFYANSGISFCDWAAFISKGKFDRKALNS